MTTTERLAQIDELRQRAGAILGEVSARIKVGDADGQSVVNMRRVEGALDLVTRAKSHALKAKREGAQIDPMIVELARIESGLVAFRRDVFMKAQRADAENNHG